VRFSPNAARLLALGPAVSLFLLAGCKPRPQPAALAGGAPRVVSLAPNLTEIVCAIGGADTLVGRSSACDYPPDVVARTPIIGDFGVPSLERIAAVNPSLVLYADIADETTPRKLDRLGLKHARIPCGRLAEIPGAIRTVGGLIGRAGQANVLAQYLERQIAEVRAKTAASPDSARPRVLILIWSDPLTAAGRQSFLSDLVSLVGGQNIGDAMDRDYFQVSGEWVLSENPDVILCFYMKPGENGARDAFARRGWDRVKAVKSGRIYGGFDNDLLLRPGPRVMQGVESLRKCLTP